MATLAKLGAITDFEAQLKVLSSHEQSVALSYVVGVRANANSNNRNAIDIGDGDVQLDAIERGRVVNELCAKGLLFPREYEDLAPEAAEVKPAWHLEDKPTAVKKATGRLQRRGSWEANAVDLQHLEAQTGVKPRINGNSNRRSSRRSSGAAAVALGAEGAQTMGASEQTMGASEDSQSAGGTTFTAKGGTARAMKVPPGAVWSLPHSLYVCLHYLFVETVFGFYFDVLQSILSGWACVIYVWATYSIHGDGSEPGWIIVQEWVLSFLFILDYLIQLYLAPDALQYMTSQMAIVDLICLLPAIALFYSSADLGFLRLLRGVRVLRILRIQRMFYADPHNRSEMVQNQMSILTFKMAAFLFVATGAMHTLNEMEDGAFQVSAGYELQFFDFLYFIMISISTMGYGDVVPIAIPARAFVMILVVAMIVAVPKETSHLSSLMDKTSVYGKPYKPHPLYGHVVLCGKPVYTSLRMFLREFYHEDHGEQNMRLVILYPEEPEDDVKELIEDMPYGEYVLYVKGEVSNIRDLYKALVFEAQAIFIMSNQLATNPHVADLDCILTAKALSKLCADHGKMDEISLFVQLLKEESLLHASSWANCDQCVCIDQLKMGLLSVTARCPGFSTMLCNLIVSTGNYESIEAQWLREYVVGYGQEIYIIDMSPGFTGWRFDQMSSLGYTKFGVCVFALSIAADPERGQEKLTLINPTKYTMMGIEQCCLIADDIAEAREFAQYMPPKKRKPQPASVIQPEDVAVEDLFVKDEAKGIDSCRQFVGHIVICGKLRGLRSFAEPLRQVTKQPIVYLHPEMPDHQDLVCMNALENMFWCQGSPYQVADLEEAGAGTAAVVIIFADYTGYFSNEGSDAGTSESGDIDTFASTVACIVNCYFSCKIVVEMVDGSYMRFLPDAAHPLDPQTLWPQYCAGNVYLANIFDSLIAQAFYNSELIGILSSLVRGGGATRKPLEIVPPEDLEEWFRLEYPEGGWSGNEASTFQQIAVPPAHVGGKFSDCYNDLLLNYSCLCIGMYRGIDREEGDNAQSYVLTNPQQNTRLRAQDKLYVLCPAARSVEAM